MNVKIRTSSGTTQYAVAKGINSYNWDFKELPNDATKIANEDEQKILNEDALTDMSTIFDKK